MMKQRRLFVLQQHLPPAVLKHASTTERIMIVMISLQQHLPPAVLKLYIYMRRNKMQNTVATTPTACGIETIFLPL